MASDVHYMRRALRLAERAFGCTSPNPMVGAILVKQGAIIGRGWHHRAGLPHAEIEALRDAQRRGHEVSGSVLFVTLEPCSTHGRTPPCTKALIAAGIRRVVVGAIDPNPRHAGRGLRLLRRAGMAVKQGVLGEECERLNLAFNHWIQHRFPLVTVKAAMTLDGKIATRSGESKWITSAAAREYAMHLRQAADAVLVGINTVLADNPQLTLRSSKKSRASCPDKKLRRIVLDAAARTPLIAKIVTDSFAGSTTIVVGRQAPATRRRALARKVDVVMAPSRDGRIDLGWLLRKLGSEQVTSLLVEGGGEVNASFLMQRLAHRIAFFYAPKVLGGAESRKAVGGLGAKGLADALTLSDVQWRKLGPDWMLSAGVAMPSASKRKN
jgi:diaminohydroxyphosphoribosylaminopyrimidine deaminase / 5-amino-6-(5-phosphoribosylamino)uracil reductase